MMRTETPMAVRGYAASASSELVLLVDDDRETRELYAESLSGFGLRVEAARDAAEALFKSLAIRPSVICTGLTLEKTDGFEFCRLVRQNPLTRHIPMIAVMAGVFPGQAARARDAGVDSILIKPCLPETLGAEIRRVLSRAREGRRISAVASHEATARLDSLTTRVNSRFRTFLKARLPNR